MHTKPLLTALCLALMTLPAQGKKADTITLESVPAAKPAARATKNAASLDGKTIRKIDIRGIKDKTRHDNAKVYLSLEKVVGEKIDQPDYVQYLIESGREEIRRSQQPFGYYHTQVDVQLDDSADGITVIYTVTQNEATKLGQVNLQVLGEAERDEKFRELLAENPLKSGTTLDHNTYETYKARFVALASARGYFDAAFREHSIQVNPDTNTADVSLIFDSGMRYTFETVEFNEVPLSPDLLQRFVQFQPGQPYLSSDVATLQQDLQGSGYFAEALIGDEPDRERKTVPIKGQLTMDENKHYILGIGYSTDSGVRGKFMALPGDRWDLLPAIDPEYLRDPSHYDRALRTLPAETVSDWLRRYQGQRYDWLGVFRFVFPFLRQSGMRWFCSEFVATVLGMDNPAQQSPQSIYQYLYGVSTK